MTRLIGPIVGKPNRWLLIAPLLAAMIFSLLLPYGAVAVNATGAFELDGNASSSTSNSAPPDDWDRVCQQVTQDSSCSTTFTTNGAIAVEWIAQGASTGTTFTGGGSKDPIDISSWAWDQASGGLPGKDILLNGFAARYSLPANSTTCPSLTSTCSVIFFGMDRFDNAGDAQNGFWFFQNKITLGSTKIGGGQSFNGVHMNGDVLVVSDFSIGGTISTITVYKWDTACTAAGKPDANCADSNLRTLQTLSAANCATSPANAPFCGIVNPNDGTVSPWPFTDKKGNSTFANGELYEGGINLSLFPGLATECFASTLAESRSSTSTSAVLKSFVLGNFGNCTATMSTTPSTTGSVAPGGTAVHDTATVIGNQATLTPSGTVSFSLCQFPVGDTTSVCDGTINVGNSIGTGTLSGSGATASAVSPDVNTSGSPLLPGRYCFFASWPGDSNYTTPQTADGSGECFTVAQIPTTTLSTPQPSTSVDFNASVTDHAVVTAISTADGTPTGTITFFVCTPLQTSGGACPSPNGTQVGSPVTATAVANSSPPASAADSAAITANITGTWCFRAVYTPGGTNGNNYTGSTDATSDECFLVTDTTSITSAQTWRPNDSATVSSAHGAPLVGNLSFQLYTGSDCGLTGSAVSGQLYSFAVSGSSFSAATNNTSFDVTGPSTTVSWKVVFASNDANVSGFTRCETSTVTISN